MSRLDEVNALSHSKSAGRGTSADRAGALLPLLNDLLWEATVFTRTLEPSRGNLFRIQTRDWIVVDQRDALARLALTFAPRRRCHVTGRILIATAGTSS